MFQFTYMSLSFWVEMLEACLVDEIHLMSEHETDGRLDLRRERKKERKKRIQVLRSLQTEQVLTLVLPVPP